MGAAPQIILTLPCSPDDSKSSSPEPVTHLKWDDPYYDIARHQIVEVAGERPQLRTFSSRGASGSEEPPFLPCCPVG